MTHQKVLIPFLFAVALAMGCKSTAQEPTADTRTDETASVLLDKAKAETKEAAHAMADYAYARRAEFVASMNKDLVALQEELDRLAAKIESSGGAAKADAKTKLKTAREKFSQAKMLLAQTESATESTWNGATGGFRQSYLALRSSVDETRQWLSDKIAP